MTQRIGRRKRAPTSQSFFLITARAFKKPRAYMSILLPTVPLTTKTCTMIDRPRSVLRVSPSRARRGHTCSAPRSPREQASRRTRTSPRLQTHQTHHAHHAHHAHHEPQTTNHELRIMYHVSCILYQCIMHHAPCSKRYADSPRRHSNQRARNPDTFATANEMPLRLRSRATPGIGRG